MFCHLKVFLFLCIVGMVLVVNIIFFSKLPKFRSNIFFIMNNTPGNAQRQGAEPRRASTLNAISSPKPHFHCKHTNFWSAYRMRTIHMPKVNQKNRPFGLHRPWLTPYSNSFLQKLIFCIYLHHIHLIKPFYYEKNIIFS